MNTLEHIIGERKGMKPLLPDSRHLHFGIRDTVSDSGRHREPPSGSGKRRKSREIRYFCNQRQTTKLTGGQGVAGSNPVAPILAAGQNRAGEFGAVEQESTQGWE
ncbi:MAG: hypothetical protein M0Z50_04665 [Planctomycetia bacterium]|nr:hypothetical protein [Planctomycetia bacterium]